MFWIRSAVILIVLSAFVPVSLGNAPKASASAYNCVTYPPNGHCYGAVGWTGNTFGATTDITTRSLWCWSTYGCDYKSHHFVNEELWLTDLASGAWAEVGIGTADSPDDELSKGQPGFFYAYKTPGGSYVEDFWGPLAATDLDGRRIEVKLTRNRQGADRVLAQVYNTSVNYPGVQFINTMGNGNSYLGNSIDIGGEVYGESSGFCYQSTSGDVEFNRNQWQYNTGTYAFQTRNSIPTAHSRWSASWQVLPSISSTGGTFRNNFTC